MSTSELDMIRRRFGGGVLMAAMRTLAVATMLLVMMAACTELAIRQFDEYGDRLCRDGKWSGPELCPPERITAAPDKPGAADTSPYTRTVK